MFHAVVDIESDDTDGFRHEELADIALSPNNMHPDLEIIEVNTVKVVHSHSNFGPHPDDLGFHHYMPPPKKAKDFYEAYEKGLVGLSRYSFQTAWHLWLDFYSNLAQFILCEACCPAMLL